MDLDSMQLTLQLAGGGLQRATLADGGKALPEFRVNWFSAL